MAPDPRIVPGSFVQARAVKVTNPKECGRRFGGNYASVLVCGVVHGLVQQRRGGTGRMNTLVDAEFDFGDNYKKRKYLTLRSVVHVDNFIPPLESDTMDFGAPTAPNPELVTEQEDAAMQTTDVDDDDNTATDNDELMSEVNPEDLDALLGAATEQPTVQVDATPRRHNTRTMATTAAAPSGRQLRTSSVVASPNDQPWYFEPQSTLTDINGPVRYREWGIRTATEEVLYTGANSDERYSRLDIFLMMFPPRELDLILMATNEQLELRNKRRTTKQEILKFFGVIILTTKYEFSSRSSLWSTTAPSKFEEAPSFGSKTGMGRVRFDELWQSIRFSYQPLERLPDVSSEKYRWQLVDGFVKRFNEHRASQFIPSDLICVDESISRWYGQGGDWINHGLPMYVAIDRKPENGCEIQNAACGRSGVMLQLKLVKTLVEQQNEEDLSIEETDRAREQDGVLHGTKVLKELIAPWAQSDRLICADSYFASVGAVEELARMRLRFIGVVKTATRRFPMQYLSTRVFHNRGERHGIVGKDADNNINMMAFVWLDRERRYFVCSAGSLAEGEPYIRHRWRQVSQEKDAPPERVQLTVPQPRAAELYYKVCAKIDQHNRDRQSTLGIERKLVTNEWSLRVCLSIFSMIVVDTWKVYSALTYGHERNNDNGETQKEFYGKLAAELIDNRYDNIGGRRRPPQDPEFFEDSPVINRNTGQLRSGVDAHLTPTKRRQTSREGHQKPFALQGKCKVCKTCKTTYECSVCRDNGVANPWICHTKKGKRCFAMHLAECHP